jgi:hypothetical protein
MRCSICKKPLVSKHVNADVMHAKCLHKKMSAVRARVTKFRNKE